MARPREHDVDQALEDAMQTFWAQGYEATSLSDLIAATGLSRSSFYADFSSKEKAFSRCLDRYRELQIGALSKQPSSPRAILESLIRWDPHQSDPRGCLLFATLAEMPVHDKRVKESAHRALQVLRREIRHLIRAAQEGGEISPSLDPESLAASLLAGLCGLKTVIRSGLGTDLLRTTSEGLLALLGPHPAG